MKLNTRNCILVLALAATPLLASPVEPINGVLVSSNSITIPHKGVYNTKNKVTLGGISLSWYQLGNSNLVATLPPGLPAGTYTLHVGYERGIDLALGVQGAQGPQGIQGIAGLNGTNGVDGINGTNGLNGIAGLNGTNGVNGIDGTNGVLVSNFIHAYAVGAEQLLTNYLIQFPNSVVNSGNSTNWSADGLNFIIPATGIYEIKFMLNADGTDLGDSAPTNIAVDITDATTPFVTADGVDQGYFQFSGTQTGALSGQIIEHCTAGDSICIKNVSTGAFSIGSLVPTNAPSATISITQIQSIQAN